MRDDKVFYGKFSECSFWNFVVSLKHLTFNDLLKGKTF